MDYLLLIVSSALFGGMFVFQQMYTRSEGSLLRATLVFGLLTGLMRFPLTFVLYGTNYTFHLTGVVLAVLYAAVGIGTTLFSAKAFGDDQHGTVFGVHDAWRYAAAVCGGAYFLR